MKSIWAHTLVKNEERFLWFSVMSVINYVDKMLIWDTGSSDKTVHVIHEIKKLFPNKIIYKQVGEVDTSQFTKIRQEMLDKTDSDWFLMLDGDEIWWKDSIVKVVKIIHDKGDEIESIVVPNYNLIGDVYHYQEEAAGRYQLAGRRGHLALRAINREIPGIKSKKPHGTWGWIDGRGKMIQERATKKILYVDAPYLHGTFLQRSSTLKRDLEVPKRKHKLKYELGIPFENDFYYPEVFFRPKPAIVPSPWIKMDNSYKARGLIQTPLKKIKRRLWQGGDGY